MQRLSSMTFMNPMTKKTSLSKSLATLKTLGKPDEVRKQTTPQNRKIETVADLKPPKKVDGRKNNGGHHNGGRKPGGTAMQKRLRKQLLEDHFGEEVEVRVKDRKTGVEKIVMKPRAVVIMERLYMIGMGLVEGDSAAIDKWLNRALGKAPQPLVGDEEEDPVQVDLGIGRIIDKAYGDTDSDED